MHVFQRKFFIFFGQQLVGNIQIESRGFVYSSEVKSIHTQIYNFAKARYLDNNKKRMDTKENLKLLKDALSEHITNIIGRTPMLMVMYVYINKDPKNPNVPSSNESSEEISVENGGFEEIDHTDAQIVTA